MKMTTRSCMLASALSLIYAGSASAAAVHTDIYSAGAGTAGILLVDDDGDGLEEFRWTFNLLNDGYNTSTESITSASIAVTLTEAGNGSMDIAAELEVGDIQEYSWTVTTGTETFILTSITSLSATGLLEMEIEADGGSFYFNEAELNANAVSAVPVPAAAWLFGSGLLGLAGFARAGKKA